MRRPAYSILNALTVTSCLSASLAVAAEPRGRPLFSLQEGAWSPDRLARGALADAD